MKCSRRLPAPPAPARSATAKFLYSTWQRLSGSATATGAKPQFKRGRRWRLSQNSTRTSVGEAPQIQSTETQNKEFQIREEFFRTRNAAAMLAARTDYVDEVVRQRWSWMPPGIALAAVGGYGRRELFPYSDIDLLIIIPSEKA